MMKISILTLFPEMCNAFVNESIIGRAVKSDKVDIECINIRDFANNKHNGNPKAHQCANGTHHNCSIVLW